jgi:hypothetical protein
MSALRVKSGTPNKKTARRRSLYSPICFDQAASIALLRRRYVIAPIPAKPRIIMAQVEGSGTAGEVKSGIYSAYADRECINVAIELVRSTRESVSESDTPKPSDRFTIVTPAPS